MGQYLRERERMIISQSHGALETKNQTGVDFEMNLIEVIGCMVDQGHDLGQQGRGLPPSVVHAHNKFIVLALPLEVYDG